MYYIEIKNLQDLENLIEKLINYLNSNDLSINEIKEKSRIITMLTYFSKYTISFSTVLELYSKQDKKEVIYYVLSKLYLPNKEQLLQEFNERYLNNNNEDKKDIIDIQNIVENKEIETVLENDVKISNIIKEVEDEVKYMSVKKLDEENLENIKSFAIMTDEERNFIRNNTIENKKIIKLIMGGKTFEVKENNDIIIVKIPLKSKVIIDKNVIFDYENYENEDNKTNIFQEIEKHDNINMEKINLENDDNNIIKKKRGRKPKILSVNDYKNNEIENIENNNDNDIPKKKRGRKPKNLNKVEINENNTIKRILDI